METVEAIESAVAELSQKDLANFRRWFAEFDADAWDEQMKEDVRQGKLDSLAAKAIADFRSGRCKEL